MAESDEVCTSWFSRDFGGIRTAVGAAILVTALLFLIPPHGILSENEENYFALAERFLEGSLWPQTTAVFDASGHRALSDATLGALISAVGYAPAQILTRLLAVGSLCIRAASFVQGL